MLSFTKNRGRTPAWPVRWGSISLLLSTVCCFAACGSSTSATDTISIDIGPDVTECPDGSAIQPDGLCSSPSKLCPPGAMPRVDGGCLHVGPRACPLPWDMETELDCDPSELLPCPDGFNQSSDGSYCVPRFDECAPDEVPQLGGGCLPAGPRWGEDGLVIPFFNSCAQAEVSLPGGECAAIGPRACPKLWAPEAEQDCSPGEVSPCPEGWNEDDDGSYCTPDYADCGKGELALPGGDCVSVVTPEEQCPSGPFPEPGDATAPPVYVASDSSCTMGCGTEDSPHATIQAALDEAPDGAVVLIGGGTYAEGVAISRPVRLVGLCPSKVTITGSAPVETEAAVKIQSAGLVVTGTDDITISGITVASTGAGIAIAEADGVELSEVRITGGAGVGIYTGAGATVALSNVWVTDLDQPPDPTEMGAGLWVGGGSKTDAINLLVEDVTAVAGVGVVGGGSTLQVSDSNVRATKPGKLDLAGAGARANGGGTLTLERVLLAKNSGAGVSASLAGKATITDSLVRDTLPYDGYGSGVQAWGGAKLNVSRCVFDNCKGEGASAEGTGTELHLEATVIRDTKLAPGCCGAGTYCEKKATCSFSGCIITSSFTAAIVANNSQVHIGGSILKDTKPVPAGDFGYGVFVDDDATVQLLSSRVSGNTGSGLTASGAGAILEITSSVVSNTNLDPWGDAGFGVVAAEGAVVNVTDSLVEANHLAGVLAEHADTDLALTNSLVRDTGITNKTPYGIGALATLDANLTVSGSLLSDNASGGAACDGEKTTMLVHRSQIRDVPDPPEEAIAFGAGARLGCDLTITESQIGGNGMLECLFHEPETAVHVDRSIIGATTAANNGTDSIGIGVIDGAQVIVADSLVARNSGGGIIAVGAGALVEVQGSLVEHTAVGKNLVDEGDVGAGVGALAGALITISESLIRRNAAAGLLTADPGSEFTLTASEVSDGMPMEPSGEGLGALATTESSLHVSSSLFQRNLAAAVAVMGGAKVDIETTAIVDTLPMGDNFGWGLGLQQGGLASLDRVVVHGNREAGIAIFGQGSELLVSGSAVRTTLPTSQGEFGYGVAVQGGASVKLESTHLQANETAGGVARGPGTLLHLEDSAVTETRAGGAWLGVGEGTPGDFQVFGDGLLATGGSALQIDSSVVASNQRCGAYYDESSGAITQSTFAGNGSYGLALDGSEEGVAYADGDNQFLQNAADLPEALAAEVSTSPQGLPVPPPPTSGELPTVSED